MIRADSVHSTPPINTPIDTTRRSFLGGTAAALAAGTAVNVAALATMRPAVAASDPIYAAIEAHKSAFTAAKAVVDQHTAFERELSNAGRLRDRTEDDERRERELDAATGDAWEAVDEAACNILGAEVTTLAGLLALLKYAIDHDTPQSIGWPDDLVEPEVRGPRCWYFFLVRNLMDELPKLCRHEGAKLAPTPCYSAWRTAS